MKNLIAFISLCTLSFISFSAEPIVGVGTHFAWKRTYMEDLLTWSKHGQIKSIRDEIYWKDVERTSGILKIEGRAEFALQSLTRAHESGLHPLIILGYGNPNYDRAVSRSHQKGESPLLAMLNLFTSKQNISPRHSKYGTNGISELVQSPPPKRAVHLIT